MSTPAKAVKKILAGPVAGSVRIRNRLRAKRYADGMVVSPAAVQHGPARAPNPLREFFEANKSGPGIWKWTQYFDAYERHLRRFVGTDVHILEIGIYSGGSLRMWREYFGAGCRIYGVDIEPACRCYENDHTRVFIGDQADRSFWAKLRAEAPRIDIVIDDGGHLPEQQLITLEETLGHLSPGGVYMCEDIHGSTNPFKSYVNGLTAELYDCAVRRRPDGKSTVSPANRFQSQVASIHHYPYLAVIERTDAPVSEFSAPRHGTEWQPFL